MRKRKLGSALTAVFALCIALVACGQGTVPSEGNETGDKTSQSQETPDGSGDQTNASSDNTTEPNTTDPQTNEESDYRYQDFVFANDSEIQYPLESGETLTLWTAMLSLHQDYVSEAESPFHTNLSTQTGIEIEYRRPAAGADGTQAFNMMLASNNLPDIAYIDSLHLQIETLIDDGHALILDELMPDSAPDAYALIEAYPELSKALRTDSGHLYAFPFLRGDPWLGNWIGQAVDTDILKATGLDVPLTIDDWNEFLYAAKDLVDIPLAVRTGNSLHEIFSNAFNFSYSYYVGDDNRIHLGYSEPQYKDFLKLMNQWYTDGLIDPDFVTMDTNGLRTKVINNSIAGIHIATGTFVNYHVARQEVGEEFNFTPVPVAVSDMNPDMKYFAGESPWVGTGAFITTAAKNPELAAQFLNYGYTKDGMVFWNFGVEGETFEYVDGMPTLTTLITEATEGATSALNRYSAMGANGISIMMKELNEQKNVGLGDSDVRIGNIAGDTWTDGTDGVRHRIPAISPTLEENQEFSAIQNALDTYAAEMYFNFILGAEPLDNFDSYIATLESMNLARALEIRNAQLDRYKSR